MEEEELKRAFERCVESSRPLPPLVVKEGDFIDDDDNLAALKEREDAEKAGEYLERLMMKEAISNSRLLHNQVLKVL